MMMDTASAELCKYAANSILATRISFMNEIANVCELVGADVDHVRKADRRRPAHRHVVPVSRASATAAAAFRRTCKALLKSSGDQGYDFKILRAVEAVNEPQKARLVDKMIGALRRPEGPDDRAVGPGLQAAHRRHARGAGDHDHRAPARRSAPRCGRTIPRPLQTARRIFGDRIATLREELRRAGRRRRAGDRHRMERVPRAGLREDARSC